MSNSEKDNVNHPFLTATFGGLCSFVLEKKEGIERDIAHVLMVEPSMSSIRKPRLCPHHRYIMFSAEHLALASGDFYTSVVGFDSSGEPRTMCIWDIDGCDIEIRPDTQLEPVDFNQKNKILPLDDFGGGEVSKRWLLEDPVDSLIGARIRTDCGLIKPGIVVDPDNSTRDRWKMCLEKSGPEDCLPRGDDEFLRFSQTVELDLPGIFKIGYVDIIADNFKTDRQEILRLNYPDGDREAILAHKKAIEKRSKDVEQYKLPGPIPLIISNLCPASSEPVTEERDVLAYYELCKKDIDQSARRIPRVASTDANPRESACPPVTQTLGS